MRTPTITQLEKELSYNQIKDARTRTIERLDGGLFIIDGLGLTGAQSEKFNG
jgi:hypothetical protein